MNLQSNYTYKIILFDLKMDQIWQKMLYIYAYENPAREHVHLFQNIFWVY
jgi:hypothetical protein